MTSVCGFDLGDKYSKYLLVLRSLLEEGNFSLGCCGGGGAGQVALGSGAVLINLGISRMKKCREMGLEEVSQSVTYFFWRFLHPSLSNVSWWLCVFNIQGVHL